MDDRILNHYLQFSQYTDPGIYRETLNKQLPNNVKEIGLLVRKQLIHRVTLKNGNTGSNKDLRYGDITKIPWYRQPEDDIFPTAVAMIAELYRRDSRGFVSDRHEKDKLILTCRFVSILMATLLKTKGIPCRVRSGFAPYFHVEGLLEGKSEDHWINQYWNSKYSRWIMIDVDGSIEGYLKFNPYDMPDGVFNFPADAWLAIRHGKIDEKYFRNAGGHIGLIVVAWELFYDLHCLMNSEIIYMHHPEMVMLNNFKTIKGQQLKEIDNLAFLMQKPDDNFDTLKTMWETRKELRLLKGGLL